MVSFVDYYAVLGVSPASEAVVIKAAFKALMLKYHPDTNNSPDAFERAQAINAAYAILGDPDKRATYDRQREAHAASANRTNSSAAEPRSGSSPSRPSTPRPTTDQPSAGREAVAEKKASGGKPVWQIFGSIGVISLVIAFIGISPKHDAEAVSEEPPYSSAYDTPTNGAAGAGNEKLDGQYVPTQAPPAISENDVLDGMDDFTRTFKQEGFFGVIAASEHCIAASDQSPSWSSIDRCEAFGAEADKFALSLYMTGGGQFGADAFFRGKLSGRAASQYQLLGQSHSFGVDRAAQINAAVSRLTSRVPLTMGDIDDQLDIAAKAEASAQNGL